MRPCVKKEASSGFGGRMSGQVLRGNADLTLPGRRRDKTRTPIAEAALSASCGKKQENWRLYTLQTRCPLI